MNNIIIHAGDRHIVNLKHFLIDYQNFTLIFETGYDLYKKTGDLSNTKFLPFFMESKTYINSLYTEYMDLLQKYNEQLNSNQLPNIIFFNNYIANTDIIYYIYLLTPEQKSEIEKCTQELQNKYIGKQIELQQFNF